MLDKDTVEKWIKFERHVLKKILTRIGKGDIYFIAEADALIVRILALKTVLGENNSIEITTYMEPSRKDMNVLKERLYLMQTCQWTRFTPDSDPDSAYNTECEEAYTVPESSASEFGLKYCMFCGRPIRFENEKKKKRVSR